ncbi:MAG TPA: (E)-4-hydroxy-3-methylbut-2-enyl-diphosphate synthase [Chloroflexia bacterium]|nr:(E)-4-hydroxy-3-methylbut-2-enyl-diphosphate synthase [Chloroflexia bacterium]
MTLAAPNANTNLPYVANPYVYKRRQTREVMVGKVGVGGNNPIRVQSMTTTPTQDVEATLAQTIRLVEAGCEIVRITTPGTKDARALGEVKQRLLQMGLDVPLVADIHFNPSAAMEAALYADKVRINPGNFADAKVFAVREYSDAQYDAELLRIEEKFKPVILRCKERGVSMRIGTNHGSLSDRIMNRFGDTPEGMVESALEFAALCRNYDYHEIIFSMKASNPKVMIAAYRLLVARLDALGWNYPLHLGVTEAGNAEDGRIKSAIGIGALLDDGLGDTVRVSLTEEPEFEIPVAFELVKPYNEVLNRVTIEGEVETQSKAGTLIIGQPAEKVTLSDLRDPYHYAPRPTYEVAVGQVRVGGMQPVAVVAPVSTDASWSEDDIFKAVADLAKRKGQNAIRPDLIRIPLSAMSTIAPLAEEIKRRGEEEDPSAGKSALGLVVDAGEDYAAATQVVGQLSSIGALKLDYKLMADEADWQHFDRCVEAAIAAKVPLWLEGFEGVLAWDNFFEVMAGDSFPYVQALLEMAKRAHALGHRGLVLSLRLAETTPSYAVRAYRALSSRLAEIGRKYPIHISATAGCFGRPLIEGKGYDTWLIGPSIGAGSLLCDGIGNSIEIAGDGTPDERVALAFNILQASGSRVIKAEFVACPSCGRTLFDLQETTERIKRATGHLRGVKIAVMGCIVNGLGELADADFGYMGGAPGKINLFVGKECVEKGVPTEQAVDRLIDLIKTHDKWVEAPVR